MIVNDLKKSILSYAFQGKLTKQNSDDLSALDLREKLLEARINLIKEKRILKKPFLNNDDIKPKFQIPDNWTWAYLSNVSIIQEGAGIRKHQYKKEGIQLFLVTNILDGEIDLEKKQLYISKEEYKSKYAHLKLNPGDIVTACSGGSWGKVAIYDKADEVMLNTSTLRLRFFNDLANNKYLYYVVKSAYFKKCLSDQLSGIQPNFGYAHYSTIPIPLPPIEEQQRIVDKIEELFVKLDELMPIEEDLEKIKKSFPVEMKNAILKEAFDGKYSLEEKWQTDKLNNVCDEICTGNSISENIKKSKYSNLKVGYNYIGTKDLNFNHNFNYENGIKIPFEEQNFKYADVDDILLCIEGGSAGKKIGILKEKVCYGNKLCKLSSSTKINSKFLYYYLQSPQFIKNFYDKLSGIIGGVSINKIKKIKISYPSLEEQERIVKKIEQLLSLCDDIDEL